MNYPGEVIKVGSKEEDYVKLIKAQLNKLGYGPLDSNSPIFGATTDKTIQQFQEANQLQDDGMVGRLTWERLFSPRANRPVSSTILRIRALEIMNTQLFVREKTGHNDGVEVKQYLNLLGLPEGYPWCQSLVYWCFDKAAKELKVPNPVPKTAGVLECARLAIKNKVATIIYDDHKEGDQFIMDFGGGKGHTGLVEASVLTELYTIEGNTNSEGGRDGNGVFERSRAKRTIKYCLRYE
jgi:hypothetical protein